MTADAAATLLGRARPARDRVTGAVDRRPLLVVALVALGVRLALALVSFAVNHTVLVEDEAQYLQLASTVAGGDPAEAWFPGYGQSLYRSVWVFIAPIVALFRVLPDSRVVAQLWVVGFGVLAAALTARLALAVLPRRWAVGAGLVAALLPSQVLWSSVVLREALVWCGLVVVASALLVAIGSTGRKLALGVVVLAVGLLALLFLRQQAAVAVAWAAAVAAVVAPGRQRLARAGVVVLVTVLVPVLGGVGPFGADLVRGAGENLSRTRAFLSFDARSGIGDTTPFLDEDGDVVPCQEDGSGDDTGASALAGDHSSSRVDASGRRVEVICGPDDILVAIDDSVGATLEHVPKGIAANLLRPYPWETVDTGFARLASMENVLWYGLYVLAVLGVVLDRRNPALSIVLVLVIGAVIGTSILTQGNVGTALRHRGEVLWALAVLAAMGARALLDRRARP